ncbi:hypothetical protein BOX15_Mlig023527g6 [Macrostomum lignano]|uniref:Cadherin domain-containing protein n=1 Tax=Macrostomum lignano TaxID=282301 RepID=A0A267FJ66_9PLAT|nr:hypothetical protein BOX15_Mlig023527g6 [Macrostomum lignano]
MLIKIWPEFSALVAIVMMVNLPDCAGNNPPKMQWCTNLNTSYVTLAAGTGQQDCSASSTFFIQMKEEIPNGVELIRFNVTDLENDAVTMTLTGKGQATYYFSLQSFKSTRSAVLVANSRLDLDSLKVITMPLTIQLDDGNLNVVMANFDLVIITDINDNIPEFQSLPYRWEIPENTDPSSSLVFPITVVDRDMSATVMSIEFKEVSGVAISSVFNFTEVNTTTYCAPRVGYCNGKLSYRIISLVKALDYETNRFYQISVNATDKSSGGTSTHTDVIINVLDKQDTPPFFQGIPYTKTVPENSPNGTFVLKIFAEDGDRGVPNAISYSLDPSSPFSKYFDLNNDTGDLTLSSVTLDRESAEIQAVFGTFDLPVIATEVSSVAQPANISQATTSVRIIVEDKNDFAPRFSSEVYNASVIENTMSGVPVTLSGVMSVADYDSGANGEFNLTVMKDGELYEDFDVSPATVSREATLIVRVRNVTFLDHETVKNVTFQIVARETKTSEKFSSSATVQLQIVDANDNRPVFNQSGGYAFDIPENSPNGTTVGIVSATDADSGLFGFVIYLLDGTDAYKFRINSTTGEIFVNVDADKNLTLLNRETISTIYLTVLGVDGGGFITSTLLEISLTDVNDQTPQFTRSQYSGFVRENSLTFESQVQVQAIDEDLKGNNNSLVMYKIYAGDSGSNFNITASTGILGVQSPLDFENLTSSTINLTVMAYDGGVPSLNSTVLVTVTVLDQNDNSPVCQWAHFNGTVAENATSGTPIIQINATDDDAPGSDNSRIFYRIQSGAADKFAMSGNTGLILVERGADLDVNRYGERYNLTVAVFDMGSPQRSGNCLVAITVIDVNNQRPYFDTLIRRETIPENPTINQPLPISPQYTAKDPDTTANLQYSILYDKMIAREANGQFVDVSKYNYTDLLYISSTNGTLMVKNILDREQAQEIVVPIFVQDLAAQTAVPVQTVTGTLIITLSDLNDEPPVFLPPATNNTYRINVSEGLVPPIEISLTAMAGDSDSSNPPLSYAVQPSSAPFLAKPDTGQLALMAPLDREKQDQLTFYVLANDSVHITTATVYVTVSDVNDVVPTFYQFAPSLNVSEGLSVGSLLTTVQAYDNDTGLFGTVHYRILSGNDGRFFINETTGELRLARTLDRDVAGGSAYSLLIEAFDNPNGTDSQRSSRTMAITVLDINDNAPQFAQDNYTITSLLESMEANQLIRDISATDVDAGINAEMNFSFAAIPGQNAQALNLFQVTTKQSGSAFSAVISTRTSLTRAVGWYNLTLLAIDFGRPTQTGSTNITFFIGDVNDNHPVFVYPNTSSTVLLVNESTNASSTVGQSLIQVQATDADYGNNSVIRFDLTSSGGDHNAFSIDSVTGLINISVSLDFEAKSEYRFHVRARDLGTPPLTSQISLVVQVLNVDEGPPVFPLGSRVQSFSVPENSPPAAVIPGINRTGVYIGSVAKAADPDAGTSSSTVCYFILDKVFDTFYLNKSGDLYTLKTFDRETLSQYTLHIVAVGPSECNSNKYQWRNAPTSSRRRRYLDDTPVAFDASNPIMAQVVVNVADDNDNPPVWSSPKYYGGVNVNDPPGTTVFSFAEFVTDLDAGNNSALTFSITPVLASTSQLTLQLEERGIYANVFALDNRTGVLKTGERTYFQDSMAGSLYFNVTASDSKYSAKASCTIYLLSLDQQLVFTIADVPANVTRYRDAFVNYLSNITGWQVVVDSIVTHKKDDGTADPSKSDVYIHAIDRTDNSIVPAITVQNRIDLLSNQMVVLYRRFGVLYVKLARQQTPTDQTLEILKISLIAVACGLTVLLFFSCISLWTCRRMYRRKLKAATAVAFGPSGHHSSTLKTPGTNMHAFEGSNPIWSNGTDGAQYDNRAYDSDKDSIDNNQINLASPSNRRQMQQQQQPQFEDLEKTMRFAQDNASDGGSNADDRKILDTAVNAGPSMAGTRQRNGSLTGPVDLYNQSATQI